MRITNSKGLAAAVAFVAIGLAGLPIASAEDAKPDPARIAAAKELVATMGGGEQAQASIKQFVMALTAEIAQHDQKLAKPAEMFMQLETQPDKPRVKQFIADMEDAASKFYAERFSADELKTIVAFQNSEAGKKFQKLTPELVGFIAPRMTAFQEGLIRDMQKGIEGGAAKDAPPANAGAGEKK